MHARTDGENCVCFHAARCESECITKNVIESRHEISIIEIIVVILLYT